uniref:Uncharacterized protein n=1 Tax=Arundo donax TaxID=35708 RepID=A0A0A9CAW0_ARUDO
MLLMSQLFLIILSLIVAFAYLYCTSIHGSIKITSVVLIVGWLL